MFTNVEILQEIVESIRPQGRSMRRPPPENNPTWWDEMDAPRGKCGCDVVAFMEKKRKNIRGLMHESE